MADIVLSGYYGFGNAGDEAMLLSILEALGRECPGYTVAVISGRPKEIERTYGVKGIHRLDYFRMFSAFRKAKLLLSGGGSLLQDVTSHRSIFYYLSVLRLAQWMKVPTMLYAQGIGPVIRPKAQAALRKVVNQVDLITVRDEKSKAELARLGVDKPPIYVTADPVLSLSPENSDRGLEILKAAGYQGKKTLVGFAVRDWAQSANYLTEIAEAADRLIREQNVDVVFLPMQWSEDGEAARKIRERMKEKGIFLEGEFKVREHLSCIKNLDVLVGVRLHGLIFAFLSGTPLVGLSYDPKIDSFLELIGERPAASLAEASAADLALKVSEKLESERGENDECREKLKKVSEENALQVVSLLRRFYGTI